MNHILQINLKLNILLSFSDSLWTVSFVNRLDVNVTNTALLCCVRYFEIQDVTFFLPSFINCAFAYFANACVCIVAVWASRYKTWLILFFNMYVVLTALLCSVALLDVDFLVYLGH